MKNIIEWSSQYTKGKVSIMQFDSCRRYFKATLQMYSTSALEIGSECYDKWHGFSEEREAKNRMKGFKLLEPDCPWNATEETGNPLYELSNDDCQLPLFCVFQESWIDGWKGFRTAGLNGCKTAGMAWLAAFPWEWEAFSLLVWGWAWLDAQIRPRWYCVGNESSSGWLRPAKGMCHLQRHKTKKVNGLY